MATHALSPEPAPPFPVRRFSVDEYHRMIQAGVFVEDEAFELLEGWIVPKMTRNPPHDVALDLTAEILRAKLPAGWRVRVQSAITTADSEPEPDLVVVRGDARTYLGRHPGPGDVALVVEVADSSLVRDRTVKGAVYARAGIPLYWIINLVDGCVETFSQPMAALQAARWGERGRFAPQDTLTLHLPGGADVEVAVRDVLP